MRLGVEHEYQLTDPGGALLDYGSIIDGAFPHGWRVDPVDPLAVRLPGGGVVTADGIEAELATPPVACGPTALDDLDIHITRCLAAIVDSLPPNVTLRGFSTHLNVECPRREVAVAEQVARRWSPLLMAFTQYATSPGLLVRPRWRRIEIGADHLPPQHLRSALVVAAAVTAAASSRAGRSLPTIGWPVEPSRQRFGHYVDRTASLGNETDMRAVTVPCSDGAHSFQTVVERCWRVARTFAVARFAANDLALVDAAVSEQAPLLIEQIADPTVPRPAPDAGRSDPLTRSTSQFEVWPHEITWRRAVFTVASSRGLRWMSIDGIDLPTFLTDLREGRMDDALAAGRTGGRR